MIFGISDKIMSLKKSQQQLLSCGLIVTKKRILRFWKMTETLSAKLWLEEIIKVLHLEKNRFLLVNRLDNFDKIWSPLLLYLDNAG